MEKNIMKYRPAIQTGARFIAKEKKEEIIIPGWIARKEISVKTGNDGKRYAVRKRGKKS